MIGCFAWSSPYYQIYISYTPINHTKLLTMYSSPLPSRRHWILELKQLLRHG
jgi:hypothetical protein